MTDAIISRLGQETEAEEAERSNEEKAFGFRIYLMSDAIIFALLFATFVVTSHNTVDGPGGHTLFRLRTPSRKRRCCWQAARPLVSPAL